MQKTSNRSMFYRLILPRGFVVLVVQLFLSTAVSVFAQKGTVPNAGQILKVHSTWPDALFRVVCCERLSGDRIWLQVQLVNPTGASIINVSGDGAPIPQYLTDKSGHAKLNCYAEQPYSLAKATILDEATGEALSVQPQRTGDPYPGLNCVTLTLRPDEGLIFGAIFSAPHLGVDHYPTITIELEKGRQPIKGIPVCDVESINVIDKMLVVKNADEIKAEIAKKIP